MTMWHSRRTALKAGAAAALARSFTRSFTGPFIGSSAASLEGRFEEPSAVPSMQDPRLYELVQRALDAARAAGATYADVRLTHTQQRDIGFAPGPYVVDSE